MRENLNPSYEVTEAKPRLAKTTEVWKIFPRLERRMVNIHKNCLVKVTKPWYNVNCTLYTVHCIVYTVHSTAYIVHYTLYSLYCTLYTASGWLNLQNAAPLW